MERTLNSGDFSLTITDAAVMALIKLITAETPIVRIGVKGSGCSGMEYVIRPETRIRSGDIELYPRPELHLVIDPKSASILNKTVIDVRKELMSSGFKFINANTISTCGCGRSFSIKEGKEQ